MRHIKINRKWQMHRNWQKKKKKGNEVSDITSVLGEETQDCNT